MKRCEYYLTQKASHDLADFFFLCVCVYFSVFISSFIILIFFFFLMIMYAPVRLKHLFQFCWMLSEGLTESVGKKIGIFD